MDQQNYQNSQSAGLWGSALARKAAVAALVVLSIFLATLTGRELMEYRYIGAGIPPTNVISIDGRGEVVAVPDTAEFSFSVVEKAASVATAQDAATKKMNAISAYLKEQGIEEKDIKTTGYNVYPQYEWQQITCVTFPCPSGKNVLTGYEVRQSVTVKVRDTKEAGNLLTGIGGKGASELSGLTFTVDNDEGLKAQAREKAIANAKEKAEALAKELGVRLVRVVSFSEYQDGGYPPIYYGRGVTGVGMGGDAELKVAPDVPRGENTYVSQVTVSYEIR